MVISLYRIIISQKSRNAYTRNLVINRLDYIKRIKAVKNIFAVFLCVVVAVLSFGCDNDKYEEPEITPQIIFLFSPGGLGDLSYNDCILSGVQQFKKEHPEVDLFMYSPPSIEDAERIFSDWMKRPGSNIPVIFALASSDYEYMVDKYLEDYALTDNKRILLFESEKIYDDSHIHTFQVSMFGASYLAGVTARECVEDAPCLVLLGSSTDTPVFSAFEGFKAGLGRECDLDFLADDWTGYVMAPQAYRMMGEWSQKYGFIFPVAGGSNTGIYRYSREYEDSPFLAGMDIDQSSLSPKIVGSVVKKFDVLVNSYFSQWLATGTMPESQTYGLESGYVEWELAPRFKLLYSVLVAMHMDAAVRNEIDYENAKN